MISVEANVQEATRWLNSFQAKQIPFATSLALTRTAFDVRQKVNDSTRNYIDRPTPFTQKAFLAKKATKRNLEASVYAKPIQAKYLQWVIYGGTRRPQGRAIRVPFGIKLNKYGNMPKRTIDRLLARPDTFSGVVKGVAGIWQRGQYSKTGRWSAQGKRRSTAIRLLVAWEPKAKYKKQFPFEKLSRIETLRVFDGHFAASLRKAIATAR